MRFLISQQVISPIFAHRWLICRTTFKILSEAVIEITNKPVATPTTRAEAGAERARVDAGTVKRMTTAEKTSSPKKAQSLPKPSQRQVAADLASDNLRLLQLHRSRNKDRRNPSKRKSQVDRSMIRPPSLALGRVTSMEKQTSTTKQRSGRSLKMI